MMDLVVDDIDMVRLREMLGFCEDTHREWYVTSAQRGKKLESLRPYIGLFSKSWLIRYRYWNLVQISYASWKDLEEISKNGKLAKNEHEVNHIIAGPMSELHNSLLLPTCASYNSSAYRIPLTSPKYEVSAKTLNPRAGSPNKVSSFFFYAHDSF